MSANPHDRMEMAYIEAIYFTETGDLEQPPGDADLAPLTRAEAFMACSNFRRAASEMNVDLRDCDPEQIGHDLWLTRNGHGAGFWDRPKLYGTRNATLFTALALAMEEHEASFV